MNPETRQERLRCFQQTWGGLSVLWGFAALLFLVRPVLAQEPTPTASAPKGICATIKLQINQRLAFERQAFDASLLIKNNLTTGAGLENVMQNVVVHVTISDANGQPADDQFFIRIDQLKNISGVNGDGSVDRAVTAEIHWLIIPNTDSAGVSGNDYSIGGEVRYYLNGSLDVEPLAGVRVRVRPQPKLKLDYFLTRDVVADDPFTPETETSEPFQVGLRLRNIGYGAANKPRIDSSQVKIVGNRLGTLAGFHILSCQVGSQPAHPSLTAQFGPLKPGMTGMAVWNLVSTLQGQMVSFQATFKHADDLGGEQTSLVADLNTHWLIHLMRIDEGTNPDSIPDFLARENITSPLPVYGTKVIPDTIYSSTGTDFPVKAVNATVTGTPNADNSYTVQMLFEASELPQEGWVYAEVPDPGYGFLQLIDVDGSDGSSIPVGDNAWVTHRTYNDPLEPPRTEHLLHLVDYVTGGAAPTYTITYRLLNPDQDPPVTDIILQDPSFSSNPTFVRKDPASTKLLFIGTDNAGGSGLAMTQFRMDGGQWVTRNIIDFQDENIGLHTIDYFSTDHSNNEETPRTLDVVADNGAPTLSTFAADRSIFNPGTASDGSALLLTFTYSAFDDWCPEVRTTLQISPYSGSDYDFDRSTATIQHTYPGNAPVKLTWDGRGDGSGSYLPEGAYGARLIISDPLGHQTVSSVIPLTITDIVGTGPLVPDAPYDQLHPQIWGNYVVWEDHQNGNADIYFFDKGTGTGTWVTSDPAAQEKPSVSSPIIYWQDKRSGSYDIWSYVPLTGDTLQVVDGPGDQRNPQSCSTSGGNYWVAYQDNSAGNWDIWIAKYPGTEKYRITTDTDDQINPSLSNGYLVWEDYRHGFAQIYGTPLDLNIAPPGTISEVRLSPTSASQTNPKTLEGLATWVDRREGNRDIAVHPIGNPIGTIIIETPTDEASPAFDSFLFSLLPRLVYEDTSAGLGDPGIFFYHAASESGMLLNFNSARQQEPAVSEGQVVWQDNRTGHWRIRQAFCPPVISLNTDQYVQLHQPVTIDGTKAWPFNGNPLTYSWNLIQKPAGSTTTLSSPTGTSTTITPDTTGAYVVKVYVNDGQVTGPPDTLTIHGFLTGDINGDDFVNAQDIFFVLDILTGRPMTAAINRNANVNGDGQIGLEEGIYVLEHP